MKTRDARTLMRSVMNRVEAAQARAVAELAQTQVLQIRSRVARGTGLNDAPMKPYSRAYAKRKRQAGRQAGHRDLLWTGRMLGSLLVQIEGPTRARISFSDARSKEKARWTHRRTPWFGVSVLDRRRLVEQAKAIMQALLKRS